MVILETNYGPIKIELDHKNTPNTAKNFEQYVKDGFYDEVIFHRVIDGFMVQAGGFDVAMQEKKTRASIENEADKGKSNKVGTIAMARTSDPHSASAQFFINLKDNKFLDFKSKAADGWGYCVFGEVVDGMNVVEKIAKVKTTSRRGHQDVPVDDIIIQSARVED